MRVLGLETSCDDTGVALVEDGRLLGHAVRAQDVHAEYGGVVPEFASRAHITLLPRLVREILGEADGRLSRVDAVAATIGPGLVGSLLVGIEFAKGFAMARGIPFVGVNHVTAHLLSAGLEHDLPRPFVGMVASGGHTEIYRGSEYTVDFLPKIKIETVLPDAQVKAAVEAIIKAAKTGKIGDGKVFVSAIDDAWRIRTEDRGDGAI